MRVIGWISLLAVGCGLGDGADTEEGDPGIDIVECAPDFVACGGDPQGSWDVVGLCDPGIDVSSLPCSDVTYKVTADRSSGIVNLNADGTYDREYDVDMDYELTVPEACLMGYFTCSALVDLSSGLLNTCTETSDGCDCTGNYTEQDSAQGTWTVNGSVIETDGADQFDFCIDGTDADTVDQDGNRVLWSRR